MINKTFKQLLVPFFNYELSPNFYQRFVEAPNMKTIKAFLKKKMKLVIMKVKKSSGRQRKINCNHKIE